ncbi:hypothetical protein MLD38_003899 [Melastoma candidum]|uniref:Uncharacterized protein n=1 Tax=Melastoma candidum TaxID=119954 RepID=A0ACB9S757_9MYRT|nr:hypothetical protein MLD38_003899 [Melastoma candidum]
MGRVVMDGVCWHSRLMTCHPRRPSCIPQPAAGKGKKGCLRCSLYDHRDNSPMACSFHGHTTGLLIAFFRWPHRTRGSTRSGVTVLVSDYRWNDQGNHLNTDRANWKRRWSCCAEYEDTPPCLNRQPSREFSFPHLTKS